MAVAYVLGWLAAHPVWLLVFGALAVLVVIALGLYLRLTGDKGRHSDNGEATAQWARELGGGEEWWREKKPGNVVPAFLPAPPDMGPGAGFIDAGYNSHLPSGVITAKVDSPAPAGPAAGAISPDPKLPPPVTRIPLPPVTGPAMAVLHALTAPVRAHLDAADQARREAVQAEALAAFPEWKPWPGDDTLTSMQAIKAGG